MKELEYFSNIAKSLDMDLANFYIPDCGYTRNIILCEDIEIIVLCWAKNAEVPIHYHQDSSVYTKVIKGCVEERILVPDEGSYTCKNITLTSGEEFYLPPHSFHEVRASQDSIMINIYFPPISHKDQKINNNLQDKLNTYLK